MNNNNSDTANFEAIGTGGCDKPETISMPFSQNDEGEYAFTYNRVEGN